MLEYFSEMDAGSKRSAAKYELFRQTLNYV
uniref:Uncharacterized protein n=1 Tax=Anopheles minimus TaxID=112268 RepID=A0A182WP39_9DIPT